MLLRQAMCQFFEVPQSKRSSDGHGIGHLVNYPAFKQAVVDIKFDLTIGCKFRLWSSTGVTSTNRTGLNNDGFYVRRITYSSRVARRWRRRGRVVILNVLKFTLLKETNCAKCKEKAKEINA